MSDIKERKDKENPLFANSDLTFGMPFTTLDSKTFQELFNYASVGILITNADGEIQMANKYIHHQFGYSEAELLGMKVEMLIPPRYKERHVKHRERYSGDPHSRPMGLGMELSGIKKSGIEFPVEVSLGHYTIGIENYSLAFINDITQRKETEQAIKQLNAHLEQKVKEESQSLALTVDQLSAQIKETERKDIELQRVNVFLNNIWNHAGAIIIICDKNGIVEFFNPAAEKALGYKADEIVTKHQLSAFHDTEELKIKASLLSGELGRKVNPDFDVFVSLVELGKGNGQEMHYVRKDGSKFFVSIDVTPLKDLNDHVSSYLTIAIDISEKKEAEAELRSALEKEKELNELKSRFVSMASHEFRTPLSAVLSSAYLLSKYTGAEEQPQRDKHIQRIVSSVSSLTEILNDFLSVGKIEEGNILPHYSTYDIKKQMDVVMHDIQHLLKKGQSINYEHIGEDTTIHSDPSIMKHIVTNLLSNALKFSPDNVPVELTIAFTEDAFTLSVKDHGIGIPKEDQENLFKRFFRSSNATNIQGTGLGLHIVKKYTELINGIVSFSSKEGKGTKFTITFNKKN
jgi:PAS domain S-box-containing protein